LISSLVALLLVVAFFFSSRTRRRRFLSVLLRLFVVELSRSQASSVDLSHFNIITTSKNGLTIKDKPDRWILWYLKDAVTADWSLLKLKPNREDPFFLLLFDQHQLQLATNKQHIVVVVSSI